MADEPKGQKAITRFQADHRRHLFARHYAEHGNARAAYVAAGFKSEKNATYLAWRKLQEPRVQELIQEQRERIESESAKRIAWDRQQVTEELIDNVKRAKATKPVMGKDGKPTGEYRTDLSASNRALELLGKDLGMFAERVLHGDLDKEIEGKSVEELEDYLKRLILEIGPTTLRRLLGEIDSEQAQAEAEKPSPEKLN